jgi:hypothetical protein
VIASDFPGRKWRLTDDTAQKLAELEHVLGPQLRIINKRSSGAPACDEQDTPVDDDTEGGIKHGYRRQRGETHPVTTQQQ